MPKPNVTDDPFLAGEWLNQGKLLAYPTESVWGLGCNAFDEQAVMTLLALKNRPMDKGLIVLTASDFYIQELLEPLPFVNHKQIIDSWSWQAHQHNKQATTWVLPLSDNLTTPIPTWITGDKSSVAVREISHAKVSVLCDCLALSGVGNPYGFLVSTSCNLSDSPPATSFDEAYRYFGDKIGYLLGETLGFDKPSCIRDGLTGQIVRF